MITSLALEKAFDESQYPFMKKVVENLRIQVISPHNKGSVQQTHNQHHVK